MNADELIKLGTAQLRRARERFSATGDEDVQATELLEHALGRAPRTREAIPAAAERRFRAAIERRASGEPIPYITGWTEFRGLKLRVKPGAFVPRATTEFLAEQAIKVLRRRKQPVSVDVATGIGPVALAIAKAIPAARAHGTDLSPDAVKQARANARALGLKNATFHCGSILEPVPASLAGAVDVITLHPPYVTKGQVRTLPVELREFEPHMSLTDGSRDGLGLVRPVLAQAPRLLKPGGWVLIEVGTYMARDVRSLFSKRGYTDLASTRGEFPYTRVVMGRRPA